MREALERIRIPNGLMKTTVAPLVALATTLAVSLLGIHGLISGADALQSALRSAGSAHELETIAAGIQGINGTLYHVLTLRGAQIKDFDAATELRPLLRESDRVIDLLRAWSRDRATPAQRARVETLIAAIRTYRGAVDFVSQMLDVDFVAAVSFAHPFDQNFHDLMESVDALVLEVQTQQHTDADQALSSSAATGKVFAGVGSVAVVLALIAAANMGLAAVRSHRLTRQNSLLTQMTQLDALTGLGNRRCFDETLAAAWADHLASQEPLTLVMFDIDHFKKFNDSQGHPAGDACLRQVAAAVMSCMRGNDKATRYGGEEFAIIVPGATLESGQALAERIRQAVEDCAIAHSAAGPPGIVTISLGVSSLVPSAATGPATLIASADKGLYAAKRGGRNRVGDVEAVEGPATVMESRQPPVNDIDQRLVSTATDG